MRFLYTLFLFTLCTGSLRAENWPSWRGPTGQGFCTEKKIPTEWSSSKTESKNIKWKIALEEQGNSTPVIWGDKIFLTQANKGGTKRGLLCLSKADGKLLWQNHVTYEEKEVNWNPSWYCNASPVVDGERVVVSFASAGMYCYDFSGKELWKRTDLGKFEHQYGNSSSPIFYENLAILWCGPNTPGKGRNTLLAVEKTTGKTVWEYEEKAGGSWGTPLLVKINEQDQLLLGVPMKLKSFSPKTGEELWHCTGLTQLVYTSPLYSKGVAVAMSGYGGAALAVKVGDKGDLTKDRLWHHPKNTQRVGSGMIIGEHVYMVEETGIPHCYELQSGKEVWQAEQRPGGAKTWGSMLHHDGKLYVLMADGDTLIFKASPKYELLTKNSIGPGEQTNSSLAVSEGEIFLRTFKHLYCISEATGSNK